jgi:hypothetical protein
MVGLCGWLATYDIVSVQSQVQQRRFGICPRHMRALTVRASEAQAVGCELLVLLGEPGGGFGVVGQQEEDCYCGEERGQAFEDEEPAPGAEAGGAVHVADAIGDGALKGVSLCEGWEEEDDAYHRRHRRVLLRLEPALRESNVLPNDTRRSDNLTRHISFDTH